MACRRPEPKGGSANDVARKRLLRRSVQLRRLSAFGGRQGCRRSLPVDVLSDRFDQPAVGLAGKFFSVTNGELRSGNHSSAMTSY